MKIELQIKEYITSLAESKRAEMQFLHELILSILPQEKLWFLDGKDAQNKTVSNPNIGYGESLLHYANGNTKPFYKIGLSANTGGISVYIMGLDDKEYLAREFGKKIGKASISGYCIKFKTIKDIQLEVLSEIIRKNKN